MTDNVIKFPHKETERKTDRVIDISERKVVPDLMGKTLAFVIKSLRETYPNLYFDPHQIVNDPAVLNSLQTVIQLILKSGQDRNPPPSGPIQDHKG